jgi:CpeT protein
MRLIRPIRTLTVALMSLALFACAAAPQREAVTPDDPAAKVAAMMQGHYDSRDQAAADKTYFPIALAMVPIWPQRSDGHWLYVEQAMADTPDKPYRQRVYRVYNGVDGEVVSEVYTFNEPERFVQGWRTGSLAALHRDMLQPRTGCAVHLREGDVVEPAVWQGATVGNGCASERSGAAYATAEVRLEAGRMSSWDRGFDADGKQVWGATAGAYVFVKRPSDR